MAGAGSNGFGLPGEYYTSDHIYQEELETVFYEQWLCAGRSSQLPEPGSFSQFTIGTESLLIVRETPARIRAFHNVCRHRGARLCSEGTGRLGKTIQCPYHAWTYGLNGRLVGAPHMREDSDFDPHSYPLLEAALVEWEGFLFVNLSSDPIPFEISHALLLDKFSRWRLPELRVARRIEYDVAANWKLIFENYNECYHCPLVHPALAERSPYRSGQNDLTEGPFLGGPSALNESQGSLTISGIACAPPIEGLEEADLRSVYYYSLFPNMLLSLHPDYVMVHTIRPVGPMRSRVICEWLFAPEAFRQPGFNPDDAVQFWDETNRQDWQVCEWTQLGVQSRAYRPGPFSPLESIPAAFDREYLRVMSRRVKH